MDTQGDVEGSLLYGRIVGLYSHEGTPGGHNNDCMILRMESGVKVRFDAYTHGGLHISVHSPEERAADG